MDRIHIKNLRLRCTIGFAEHELREEQDVVISLVLYTDIRAAGESDDPADLLNYRTINKAIIRQVSGARYKTLEALATAIARLVVVEHGVQKVRVAVYKPGALRFTDDVGVIITRRPGDFLPQGQDQKESGHG